MDSIRNLGLNIVGIMCIPPYDQDSTKFFSQMKVLSEKVNLTQTSMGMSSDFLIASKHLSTYVRIGSSIFGQRS